MAAPWSDRNVLRLIALAVMDRDTRLSLRMSRIKSTLRQAGMSVDGKSHKFPLTIHAAWSDPPGTDAPPHLMVDESREANQFSDGQYVATYHLIEIRKKKVTHALERKR